MCVSDCPDCRALFEIDVEFSGDTVVRPDALVVCYPFEGERLRRAPDLIFEVVSPSSLWRDERVKHELYRIEGVVYYIRVYPERTLAQVFRLISNEYRLVGEFTGEKCTFELSKCSIDFDFARLWRRGLP